MWIGNLLISAWYCVINSDAKVELLVNHVIDVIVNIENLLVSYSGYGKIDLFSYCDSLDSMS